MDFSGITVVLQTSLCEILDLNDTGVYRMYCEGISVTREQDILDNIGVEYIVRSTTEGKYDGSLILDFKSDDLSTVSEYFK